MPSFLPSFHPYFLPFLFIHELDSFLIILSIDSVSIATIILEQFVDVDNLTSNWNPIFSMNFLCAEYDYGPMVDSIKPDARKGSLNNCYQHSILYSSTYLIIWLLGTVLFCSTGGNISNNSLKTGNSSRIFKLPSYPLYIYIYTYVYVCVLCIYIQLQHKRTHKIL